MLAELRLENYAVIDNVVIEFAAGLNLLTGETGAGKSILIDALGLLLGEKASTEVIRTGAERAVVAAVFESDGAAARSIEHILETNGLDAENGSLILRREIAPGGKGRVFINNQPATVAVLKQIAPHLAVIHAQNESIVNFDAAARQELLDAYAKAVKNLRSQRLQILGLVTYESWPGSQSDWVENNREVDGGTGDNPYLRNLVDRAFRALLVRFPDVRFWELWNEPNNWTTAPPGKNYRTPGGFYIYPSNFAWLLRRAWEWQSEF